MSKYSSRFWQRTLHGNVVIDEMGVIHHTNKQFNSIFEYDENELVDKKINILIPEPYNNKHDTIMREFHAKSDEDQRAYFSVPHKVPAITKSGKNIHIEISIFALSKNKYGGCVRIITTACMEVKLQEVDERNLFAANISHELRTPLNSIINMNILLENILIGYGNIMERHDFDTSMDYITTAKRAGTLLLTQINDILDYSKLMAHKMELRKDEISLMDIIDMVVDIHAGRAKEKNIEIIPSVDPEIPDILVGDPERLAQVLINLVSNAVKFTDGGKIYVKAQLRDDITNYDEKCCILIKVKDTGIGIPNNKQNLLFKAFRQIDNSHTKTHEGTGLGLVISKKICELMDGSIYLKDSIPGIGTTFEISIPFQITERHAIQSQHIELKGKMVLVVDDEPDNLATLSAYLMKWGMIPFQANSGEMALVYVKQKFKFDLALLDIRMPKMSGITLMKKMRSQNVPYPILALSSYGTDFPESVEFDDLSEKPVVESRLYKLIIRNLYPHTKEPPQRLRASQQSSILIAEDVEDNQKVIFGLLGLLGYDTIKIVDNGELALKELEENAYDIVLLDIKMPVMDGLTAAKVINNHFGILSKSNSVEKLPMFDIKQKDRPVLIALTAVAAYGENEFYIKDGGMDDYIPKPISLEILKNTLKKYHH